AAWRELAGHAHLTCGTAAAVALACAVDHVVADAAPVADLLGDLHGPRRAGAGIRVVGGPAPQWAASCEGWADALAGPFDRRTGWPWQSEG
ncbi:MAG: hypothetical protein H7233_07340, partial [Pseudorhodobacter sp.]|nr:hypothetical protein [Frankiaceae bacterium]